MRSLEERKLRALELRRAGCSCASAVVMSFDDITNLPDGTAMAVTNGLGSGIAGMREICGAATAMAIVEGFLHAPEPAEKGNVASASRNLIERFKDRNKGCLRCSELKSRQADNEIRPCNDLVLDCVELIHERLVHSQT